MIRISLFWRLFGWFWASMLAVMLALLLTLFSVLSPLDFLPERSRIFEELAEHAAEISAGGPHQRRGRFKRGFILLDEAGLPLHPRRRIPSELNQFRNRYGQSQEPVVDVIDRRIIIGPQRLERHDRALELYAVRRVPRNPFDRLGPVVLANPEAVLAAVLVSALACLLLAGTVVRPLRILRDRFAQLGSGALDARVEGRLPRRGDEIGDLARDFNGMAGNLEQLVQQQQRLLRHVSHELRTPLTRLQLALGIAQQKEAGQLSPEHERMEREIRRIDLLLQQALQWSRLDAGLDQEPVRTQDLVKLLADIVAEAKLEAGQRNLQLQLTSMAACPLPMREQLLRAAIENLLRNAIRHAPEGSSIAISLDNTSTGFAVEIRDQGPGVSPEDLGRLTEPFFRSEQERSQSDGSGMGLAIAQGAARLHRGRLEFENRQPGLLVRLVLPFAEFKAQSAANSSLRARARTERNKP